MIVSLPLPETTNNTYKTIRGHWYKSKKAKDWEEEAGWIIKKTWDRRKMTENVMVSIHFFIKHERDIDGGIKPILDLLQRTGVIENDRQVLYLTVTKEKDDDWPRAEVCIERMGGGEKS